MKKPLETENDATRTIPVLSVNPNQEDHVVMEGIFSNHLNWVPYEGFDWALYKSKGLASALTELQEHQMAIVICEEDLYPGSWKDMLELTMQSLTPPLLIVTSRLADERLWAEALNLGAYDVLAKPFDIQEFTRLLSFAWLHWNDKYPTELRGVAAFYRI